MFTETRNDNGELVETLDFERLKDNGGRTFSTNTANEGRFHIKWLNMMYTRLYLARKSGVRR